MLVQCGDLLGGGLQWFGVPGRDDHVEAAPGQRDRGAILAALQARVHNAPDHERATALAEVAKIARFRLQDLIAENGDAE